MLTFQAAATRRAALGRRTVAAAALRPPRSFPKVAAGATIRRYNDVRLAHHSTRARAPPPPLPSATITTVKCNVGNSSEFVVEQHGAIQKGITPATATTAPGMNSIDAPWSSSWRTRGHAVTRSYGPLGDCYRAGNQFSTAASAAEGDDSLEDCDGPGSIDQRTTTTNGDDNLPQQHRHRDSSSSSDQDQLFFVLGNRRQAARVSDISLVVERLGAEERMLLRKFETEAERRTDWVALLRGGDEDEDEDEDEGEGEEVDAHDCGEAEDEIDGGGGGGDGDADTMMCQAEGDATEKAGNTSDSIASEPSPPSPSIISSPSMGHAKRIAAAGRIERALQLYRRINPLNNDTRPRLRIRQMNQELLEAFFESIDNAGDVRVVSDAHCLDLITTFAQSRDLRSAHAVLDRWIDDAGAECVPVRAYRILCDAVGECDSPLGDGAVVDPIDIAAYLFDTLVELDDEYERYRLVCLPRLLLALCKWRASASATTSSAHHHHRRPRPQPHRHPTAADGDWGGEMRQHGGNDDSHSPSATEAEAPTLSRCIRDVYSYMTTTGTKKKFATPLSSESPFFDPYVFDGILSYLAVSNAHIGRERVRRGIGEEEWGNRLSRTVREKRRRWGGRSMEQYLDGMEGGVIPCDEVLRALVDCGHYPNNDVVMTTLQNEHPFDTSMNRTRSLLKSILQLRRNVMTDSAMMEDESSSESSALSSASPTGGTANLVYRVDLGTIEQVCEAGGRRGKPDVVLLCWDLAESMGYHQPTEVMYESAIQAFLTSNRREDHHALAVLSEMEGCGYVPSMSLIRTFSECTRRSPRRIDNMYYILINGTDGTKITTASFNCVLSAYGQSGLIDRAFATFDDFAKYDITPNVDSFSFLMESLAFHVVGFTKQQSDGGSSSASGSSNSTCSPLSIDLEQLIESADMINDMMKDIGYGMNPHVFHQYVRVLTCGGELQRARSILEDAIASGDRVLIDTLVLFGRQCAFRGEMDIAKDVVSDMIRRAGYTRVPHILRATISSVARADADSGNGVEEVSASSQDKDP